MKNGFLRVAAATPKIKVADCIYNREQTEKLIDWAVDHQVQLLVLPELGITGYTCSDLFLQNRLLDLAKTQILQLRDDTKGKNIVVAAGFPMEWNGGLYNLAAVLFDGKVLGLVPKHCIPNYSEFYEARHFKEGMEQPIEIEFGGEKVWMGTNLLFQCETIKGFTLAVEICEDLWVPCPPSIRHALAGATVIANLSASNETTGKDVYRRQLVESQSARLICGYIYADAGEGESSTDLVFAAHNLIAENGTMLAEAIRFQNQAVIADLDLERIRSERRRMKTFGLSSYSDYQIVFFAMQDINRIQDIKTIQQEQEKKKLYRYVDPTPFVPYEKKDRDKRCKEILSIQAMGLKKRLEHTNCQSAVLGISGGLDSTLALLVTVRAFGLLGLERKKIMAVTMPCFGTTDRTYQNAVLLIKKLGAELKEVDIRNAVQFHFQDIGQDPNQHDVTYENAQARERTQVLMDLANQTNGMVIGTGDMSELALGWATYNGDHMSMYGVNASVPKTLVRHLVRYYADTCKDSELASVLMDILATPVSPELLPPKDGEIAQKTEDIVGPYDLHDFYLYYILRFGYTPSKIYILALKAFEGVYEKETILKWLKTFYQRFFSQQFKRSCLPDGPKVGSVTVSPRGDLRMPSDACMRIWMDELEQIQNQTNN